MEKENGESSQSVRVAVNIRPLVTPELLAGCTDCITVFPAEKQVHIGSHSFTFDYVFGSKGSPSSTIYDECVAPLVDALMNGYNGTVLAYGQTGSGKTYTMGTNYNGEEHRDAVIPKVMDTIFSKMETMKETTEFLLRVSFIEIFKEDVFDLLDPKTTGPTRVPIQIRETVSGGITLAGVTESEVTTKEEMVSYLLQGSLCRATGSTKMNSESSRSHAIFTISMEQRRTTLSSAGDDVGDDVLIAKLHLVDLAGSERVKRTGADGSRLQEGIHINKGLLALGNVISALGDDKKRKGGHVPYRDSKLTRILQDSLGGNSKTIMIACVSPADTNAEETLNTLKYANRARNIQNKAIVNRDPTATQMQKMRNQIEQLQSELLFYRGDSSAPTEEIKILKHKVSLLEASKLELQDELHQYRTSYEHLKQRAQAERDRLVMLIGSIQNGTPFDENYVKCDKDFDLAKSYLTWIQELEDELVRIRSTNNLRRENSADFLDPEDDGTQSRNMFMDSDIKTEETGGAVEDVEKELEHCSIQEQMDRELKELEKSLEQKEAEMKQFGSGNTSVLKQHYEKKIHELEYEKRALEKEIEDLRHNLSNVSSNPDDSAQKLNVLEKQLAELKKKQDAQAQALRQKEKSEEAAKKRLQDDIQRIKTQKVQLQHKMKQESEQFRQWKASREKEVLQLKKEGRRNEYEMHKLLALNQRQKLVLQRKTEEAAMATKRLKDLLDSRKASREPSGAGSNRGPGIQALVRTIEHELEVTIGVHEVRTEYDRQLKERAKMAEELSRLKEETLIQMHQNISDFPQAMSPGARNSRIFALENMLATSSSTLVSMGSQLSEAEELERTFSGRGRWNQVRALSEAKNVMNFLFNLASSTRCQLRDREVDCREKDSEIKELKEKIVNLVRQLELKKAESCRQENLMRLALERQRDEKSSRSLTKNSDGHAYDLRPKGPRNYSISPGLELLEDDMDTSDDEYLNLDEDTDSGHTVERRKRQSRRNSKMDNRVEQIVDLDQSTSMTPTEGICCSCSNKSFCKTSRCECRAVNGICSSSCSCGPTKCRNREESTVKDMVLSVDMSISEEVESSHGLASHGAMLLQTALSETHTDQNTNGTSRKPLSDIGNNLGLSGVPKPNPRKKWRKSTIQLVPAAAPPVSQPHQNTEAPDQAKANTENDIPLKLPRAMRSALTNNNQLKDRNTGEASEPIDNDICTSSLGSPHHQAKARNGKENKGV